MALGKKCSALKLSKRGNVNAGEELGLGFVRCTRALGRKRIVISNDTEASPIDSGLRTPLKKHCSKRLIEDAEKSTIESLSQDILIRILCGVNHDDLEQLFHVSKTIREAALIAKQWHFAYNTPSKKTRSSQHPIDFENPGDFDEIEAPNAPKQLRSRRSRVTGRNLADISVALFASPDEEPSRRRGLFNDTEIRSTNDKSICK